VEKNSGKFARELRNQNSKSAKIFRQKVMAFTALTSSTVMTLQHWVLET